MFVLAFLPIMQQEELIGWSYKPKDQNLSYQGKFQWKFDQGKGNLVQVSGELELSEFELTK